MSKTITVSTLAELKSALSGATGGETILLQGGDYGKLALSSVDFPSTVTIASADPDNPAVFSGLSLKNVSDLTFDGVLFDYTFSVDDATWFRPFSIEKSDNVTIRNSTFDGDLAEGRSAIDDGYGAGYGLGVRGGSNITVENNEFYNFNRGAVFSDISGLTVSSNDLHGMSSDGMDFVQVQNVLIEGNFLHDFQRSPDSGAHPDMIQFWTNGTNAPSGDIILRGNRLDIGEGAWTQSIFMRNEVVDSQGGGAEMFYYNVLIEDNVIVNGHLHGITVGETNGLTIRNNTLVHADGHDVDGADGGIEIPSIRVAAKATDVTIIDNITIGVNGYNGQPGWIVDGNLLLSPTVTTAPSSPRPPIQTTASTNSAPSRADPSICLPPAPLKPMRCPRLSLPSSTPRRSISRSRLGFSMPPARSMADRNFPPALSSSGPSATAPNLRGRLSATAMPKPDAIRLN
jgi:hypothetical protein